MKSVFPIPRKRMCKTKWDESEESRTCLNICDTRRKREREEGPSLLPVVLETKTRERKGVCCP